MNELIQLLIRHGLASAGGFFAAHNITGDTTVSIIVGLIFCLIPTVWSWFAKMLHLDLSKGGMGFVTGSEGLRLLVGSLVSQGVTALSVYFAVDANNPELLLGALANVGASKLGLHQKVLGVPGAVKLLTSCLCVLSLNSCAPLTAFMASNAGQATVALAELGLNVAAAKGKITTGDNVAIQRGLAIVTNPEDPTSVKVFSLAELGLQAAVARGVVKQGDALIIQEGAAIIKNAVIAPQLPSAKQPVKVLPTAAVKARQKQLKPELHNEDDGPGCMQLAERIPVYGERVAFMLSTVNVRN